MCRKPSQFLLLTEGGLREIESLAYSIVMSEESSRRSFDDGGDQKSYISGISNFESGDEGLSPITDRHGNRLHSPDDDFLFDDDDNEDW